MRPDDLFSKPSHSVSGAVLDAPESVAVGRRRSRQPNASPRDDFSDDFANNASGAGPYASHTYQNDGFDSRRQSGGYRVRLEGTLFRVPKSLWGRIFTAIGVLLLAAGAVYVLLAMRAFFLHDSRFTVESSSSIQIVGNSHLTRAQLLSIFGEDVDRNIFNIPLQARRAELESLPWVAHANVMRLLPNHLRIAIDERTPVAFVRQGSQIGMVDGSGVLLDIPPDAPGDPHYSFPVITGISANDPLSVRSARMKLYKDFTTDLDGAGTHISAKLSEVDLSNPEDIRALIPEGAADILVHFGDTSFLARYRRYQEHLQEWRTQYPKLASVDMRYERQVVLEMQPGAAVPQPPAESAPLAAKPITSVSKPALKPVSKTLQAAKTAGKPAAKPVAKAAPPDAAPDSQGWHMVVVKPHAKASARPKAAAPSTPTSQAGPQ